MIVKLGLKALCALALVACLSGPAPGPAVAGDLPAKVSNSLGMEFVLIQPGSFTMGSPDSEPHRQTDEAAHRVVIKKPFYMQATEVTKGQWRALMGSGFFDRQRGPYNHPATKVSWFQVMDFITKLNQQGKGKYRLPTEAEWEYACRAGSQTAYFWGPEPSCKKALYSNNTLKAAGCVSYLESRGIEPDGPGPVKSFAPNAWGLYDMHGNVWEWCADWYAPYAKDERADPKGPGSGQARVRRGGSYYREAWFTRSANRNFAKPSNKYDTLGFRLVKVIEQAP